jgi:transcriptional regulator with XRE-family HTH domain
MSGILDVALIKTLRMSNKLSLRAIADRLGVSVSVVRCLEEGANHRSHPLDFLVRLADVLGTTPGELLLTRSSDRSVGADDAKLEAALALAAKRVRCSTISRTFGWDLDRVKAAAGALSQRLDGTGLTLAVTAGGLYALRPRTEMLTATEVCELARRQAARQGLYPATLRVLRKVAAGVVPANFDHTPSAMRPHIGALLKQRLIEEGAGMYRLTHDAAFSLCASSRAALSEPETGAVTGGRRAASTSVIAPRRSQLRGMSRSPASPPTD